MAKSKSLTSTADLLGDIDRVREKIALNSEATARVTYGAVSSQDVSDRIARLLSSAEASAKQQLHVENVAQPDWRQVPKEHQGAAVDDLGITTAAKFDLLGLLVIAVGADRMQSALSAIVEESVLDEHRLSDVEREVELIRLRDERVALERTEELLCRTVEAFGGNVSRRGMADLQWVLATDEYLNGEAA